MKLNLKVRLVPVFAATCALVSFAEVIFWACAMPSDLASSIEGGCIACLYPYADLYRRRHVDLGDLSGFAFDQFLMWLPIIAITVIHQTLPMLVMASVFFSGSVYHFRGMWLHRLLMGAAFLIVWGLIGRAAVGRDWLRMDHVQLVLLFVFVPASVLTTIYSERIE